MLDITNAPFVAIEALSRLPASGGVYIAMSNDVVLYVGMTTSFNKRWRGHHMRQALAKYSNVTVRYFQMSQQQAVEMEQLLITQLQPPLNLSRDHGTSMVVYVTEEQRADMKWLAEQLDARGINIRDKRGNISYSALFRLLVEQEVERQRTPATGTGAANDGA